MNSFIRSRRKMTRNMSALTRSVFLTDNEGIFTGINASSMIAYFPNY